MKIHSIAKVLMVPTAFLFVYLGYLSYSDPYFKYAVLTLVPLVLLVLLYLFQPQIDYHYHTRYPLKLDEQLIPIIKKVSPYYSGLQGTEKETFENRLALYIEGRDFKGVGSEQREIPYDIKGIISAIPVEMTMHKKDYLIGDMDRIFAYKHPFPTPRMQFLHAVETHIEDGMIIFSLEQFNLAQQAPDKFYNILWHAYVDIYFKIFKDDASEIESFATWDNITSISTFSEDHVMKITGLKSIDPLVVLSVLYFTHAEEMKRDKPNIYSSFERFFS